MITYDWIFTNFEVLPSYDGFANVVSNISWVYKGTAEDGKTFSIDGVSYLGAPDVNNFTSFDQLTKDWAIEVCSNNINNSRTIGDIQEHIALDISLQVPAVSTEVLPPPF